MKRRSILIAATVLALLPAAAMAAPKKVVAKHKTGHTKVAAATTYECVTCHMTYSAADAKKDHYKCTMDGGKLAPVKASSKKTM
jgi:hypothetical protein